MHSFESRAAGGLTEAQALRLHLVEQLIRSGQVRGLDVEELERIILRRSLPDSFLLTLNRAAAADPEAVSRLIDSRVRCNKALADDPTILCGKHPEHLETDFEVGILGLLNGILADLGEERGVIAAAYDMSGKFSNFTSFNPKHHEEARACTEYVSDDELLGQTASEIASGALSPNEAREGELESVLKITLRNDLIAIMGIVGSGLIVTLAAVVLGLAFAN